MTQSTTRARARRRRKLVKKQTTPLSPAIAVSVGLQYSFLFGFDRWLLDMKISRTFTVK